MNETAQYVRFLIGMLIVGAVAGMSFNRPSWVRTYTSFLRYYASALLFIFCQALIYYLLTVVAGSVASMAIVAQYAAPSLTSGTQTPFAMILVSVALTILVAQHPLIDRTLRNTLHTLAGVPDVAQTLTQTLVDAPLHVNEEQTRNAKLLLLRRGIDCDQDWLAPARTSQDLFLKATIVYLQVRTWDEQGQLFAFLSEVHHDFDRLRERFDRLSLKFSRTLGQIERLGDIKRTVTAVSSAAILSTGIDIDVRQHFDDVGVDAKLKKVINDMLLELQEDVSAFYRALCRILARWALSHNITADECARQLRLFGYELSNELPRSSYNSIASAAVVMLVSVFAFFAIVVRAPAVTLPMPVLAILITIVQVGALVIAIVPKLIWGFANAGIDRRTPLLFVLGAGLAATLFSLLVNVIAGLLRMKGWHGLLERLVEAAPYLPSAFATAAATAFLVQDHRWGFLKSQRIRRAYDAIFMAFVWFVVSFVTTLLAINAQSSPPLSNLIGALFGFAIGFVIGYIVPGSFRETRSASLPLIGTVDLRLRKLQDLRRFLRRSSATNERYDTVDARRVEIAKE